MLIKKVGKKVKAKKSIKKISPYSEGKSSFGKVIKMSSNETPFGLDASSRKALLECMKTINRYPVKEPRALKEIISKGFNLKYENINLGNGSDELIQFIFMAFIEKNNNVIIPEATFLMYSIYADIFGVKSIISKMRSKAIDLEDIYNKINKYTKAVFIANPNNPTGLFIKESELIRFIKKVPAHVLIVVDAAYIDFSEDNFERSFKNILGKGKKNVIFLRTFSKSFGIAGLRIGYSVTDKETCASIEKMRQPFNINSPAITLAENILKRKDLVKNRINKILIERKRMENFFIKNKIEYLESHANFICFKIPKSLLFIEYCKKRGLFIRDLSSFAMKGYMRVTISLKKHNSTFRKYLLEFINNKKR